MSDVYLYVHVDALTGGYQLALGDENEPSYRLAGPKYSGNSTEVKACKIDAEAVREIRRSLNKAFPEDECPEYGVRYSDGEIMRVPSFGHAKWNLVPSAVIVVKDDNGEWVEVSDDVTERAVEILTYHQRRDAASCTCGWSELGRSYAAHQVKMLREAGVISDGETSNDE